MTKKIAAFALALVLPIAANASCIGSGNFYTCSDPNGNNYTVNKFGNTTQVNGSNSATGSTWSQTTHSTGNMAIHNGTAANGNSWNGTSTNLGGGMVNHSGTDSRGNYYNKTCNQFGCF